MTGPLKRLRVKDRAYFAVSAMQARFILLIDYMRSSLAPAPCTVQASRTSRHLNSDSPVLLVEFNRLKRDYQEHQNENDTKLVAITGDRTHQAVKWDIPAGQAQPQWSCLSRRRRCSTNSSTSSTPRSSLSAASPTSVTGSAARPSSPLPIPTPDILLASPRPVPPQTRGLLFDNARIKPHIAVPKQGAAVPQTVPEKREEVAPGTALALAEERPKNDGESGGCCCLQGSSARTPRNFTSTLAKALGCVFESRGEKGELGDAGKVGAGIGSRSHRWRLEVTDTKSEPAAITPRANGVHSQEDDAHENKPAHETAHSDLEPDEDADTDDADEDKDEWRAEIGHPDKWEGDAAGEWDADNMERGPGLDEDAWDDESSSQRPGLAPCDV
ncbi:hypothetical protein FA95DRAFT_1669012 [Auriscalpium vulgare]|uniref:Uncharacterized protein n=1 Tax=Auriscalpium vulgare TaxID=40419 RepID=A0ACB8R158_9AGAM|nr:hypothetical protein FA95DRAFT_1669012 [Auriscalpium vulgare]